MGIDIYFTVECRREDGEWERAEELRPNDPNDHIWFDGDDPPPTLRQPYIHARWQTLDARNRWLQYLNLPAKGLPEDASIESREYLQYYTEESGRSFLTFRELEALDWSRVNEDARWTNDVNFGFSLRDDLLSRLRLLGGPDDVRIVYGWNI